MGMSVSTEAGFPSGMTKPERGRGREQMKAHSVTSSRILKAGGAVALAVMMMVGCASQQDKAIESAKKQAAATGQAQQVVSVDKNGNTTTTVVQPPAPGQTAQAVTTTVTPGNGAPANGQANGPGPAGGPQQAVGGGAPVIRPADVNIPAGSELAIRINQSINVKHTQPGSRFDGEVVDAWTDANGRVILPKGTPVEGVVDASHRRGHFKGSSILQLRLTSLTLNGTQYPIETRDLTRTKKGKGKRSAALIGGGTGLGMNAADERSRPLAFIGGGTGLGMLIGGVASGG